MGEDLGSWGKGRKKKGKGADIGDKSYTYSANCPREMKKEIQENPKKLEWGAE